MRCIFITNATMNMDKDEQFYRDLENLRLKYKLGDIPKITNIERQILEFCHSRDMIQFLKEEFEKHPILLDEDGGLIGENPFKNERQNDIPNENGKWNLGI